MFQISYAIYAAVIPFVSSSSSFAILAKRLKASFVSSIISRALFREMSNFAAASVRSSLVKPHRLPASVKWKVHRHRDRRA